MCRCQSLQDQDPPPAAPHNSIPAHLSLPSLSSPSYPPPGHKSKLSKSNAQKPLIPLCGLQGRKKNFVWTLHQVSGDIHSLNDEAFFPNAFPNVQLIPNLATQSLSGTAGLVAWVVEQSQFSATKLFLFGARDPNPTVPQDLAQVPACYPEVTSAFSKSLHILSVRLWRHLSHSILYHYYL